MFCLRTHLDLFLGCLDTFFVLNTKSVAFRCNFYINKVVFGKYSENLHLMLQVI